ncbi:MAG: radical SAM protein, partial [Methylococcales bacterium]
EMRVSHRFERSTLGKEKIERILEAAAKRGVVAVSFTGGEPFLHFEALIELIRRAGDLGIPLIRTGTSGYFLRHHTKKDFRKKVEEFARPLADSPIRNFWLSVDSAQASVHDRIRGFPGVFEGIAKSIPIFHEYGIWPTANLGVNRFLGGTALRLAENPGQAQRDEYYGNCIEALGRFYRTVIELGFTIVNFCYPMSIESQPESDLDSVYLASSADDMVNFRREEKALLFQAMLETVAKYRDKIRIFTPRNMLYSLVHQYRFGKEHGFACRGGKDFFFISAADGDTYPCGFRANENLGKYWSMPNKSSDSIEHCTRCDWECFRDPSNTLGPFHEFSHSPGKLIKRLLNDRDWVGLWWQDLQYQRAADFCNGRLPPDYSRLRKFSESPGVSVNRNWNEWRPLLWQKISNIELKKLLRVC